MEPVDEPKFVSELVMEEGSLNTAVLAKWAKEMILAGYEIQVSKVETEGTPVQVTPQGLTKAEPTYALRGLAW